MKRKISPLLFLGMLFFSFAHFAGFYSKTGLMKSNEYRYSALGKENTDLHFSQCKSHCEMSELGNFVCTFASLWFVDGDFYAHVEDSTGRDNVTISWPFTAGRNEGANVLVRDVKHKPKKPVVSFSENVALTLIMYRLGVEVYAHTIIDGLFPLYTTARQHFGIDDYKTIASTRVFYIDLHNAVLGNKYNSLWSSFSELSPLFVWDVGQNAVFSCSVIGHHYRSTPKGKGRDPNVWQDFGKFMSHRIVGYNVQQQKGLIVLLNREKGSETRALLNEWDLVGAIRLRRISIISAESGLLSLRTQIILLRSAEVVIGPHGSNLANLAYVHLNTSIIEIQPDGIQSSWYQELAAGMGLRYFTGNSQSTNVHHERALEYPRSFYVSMSCNVSYMLFQINNALNSSYKPVCLRVNNQQRCE